MNCETPAEIISCAIIEATQPQWFDYVAYLVVPMFLGIVTLAVAYASWKVARESLGLSRTIVDDRKKSDLEERKLALADQVFRWSAVRWLPGEATLTEMSRRSADFASLSAALSASGIEGSGAMLSYLSTLNDVEDPKGLVEVELLIARSLMAGRFPSRIEAAVIEWLRRPDGFEEFLTAHREYVAADLREARKHGRKRWKKTRSAIGDGTATLPRDATLPPAVMAQVKNIL